MNITERAVESPRGLELYLTAVPEVGREPAAEAEAIFAALADAARRRGARLLRDRAFVPVGQEAVYQEARTAGYGPDAASIPCNWLSAGGLRGDAACGALGGVQAHAVLGPQRFMPLTDGGRTLGWSFEQDGFRWAITGGLCAPHAGARPAQAKAVFELGECLCRQAGAGLGDVARTWFFLDRILDWYGDFNRVRNALFIERGLMRRGQSPESVQVPASTGIGVRPIEAQGAGVAMELLAVRAMAPSSTDDGTSCIRRLAAIGKQRCAYEYGSAFARAAELPSPAGHTVSVSGTAAIDTEGRTCHVGQIGAQIRMTIDNALAVLRDARCRVGDVVQAMAYCKTPAVAEAFVTGWRDELRWPWVIVIGDVCRDDLLFEAEALACLPVPMRVEPRMPRELEEPVLR